MITMNNEEELISLLGQFALHNGVLRVVDSDVSQGGKEIQIEWPDGKAKQYRRVVGGLELKLSNLGAQYVLGTMILKSLKELDSAFGS